MEPALAIQEFLEYIVAGLVEYPDEASVEREERDGVHLFLIRLHPEDSTRIIGRSGKTILAIRGLVLASAEKHRVRADVEVVREPRE
jgi:predicted RNA-binding protein YlqC (UPF0109 family)